VSQNEIDEGIKKKFRSWFEHFKQDIEREVPGSCPNCDLQHSLFVGAVCPCEYLETEEAEDEIKVFDNSWLLQLKDLDIKEQVKMVVIWYFDHYINLEKFKEIVGMLPI
jgi:hypothetical protein